MRNKRRNRIFLLLILLLGVTIGFAALATTLKINGNASITKNTWDIYWDNIANKSGVTPTTEPVISADENNVPKTLVTWGVTLDKPGDYYEFEVDAVNNGSIDAMITSIESKINNSSIISTNNGSLVVADPSPVPSFIKYSVKYADGEEIELNHLLAKKTNDTPTRETYKIRVEYDRNAVTNSDVNNQQSDITYTFSFAVTYGQADNNARDRNVISLALGDYFTLVPDVSTYTLLGSDSGYTTKIDNVDTLTDQIITPNELTLWRVIKINENGTYDAVSEYVPADRIIFSGVTGFTKYIETMQKIAAQYSKEGYTVGTRMMGYDGQTLVLSDTSMFDDSIPDAPQTADSPSPTSGEGEEYSGGALGDSLYLKDYQLVSNVYSSDPETYGSTGLRAFSKSGKKMTYWLASRWYTYYNEQFYNFHGRTISGGGTVPAGDLHGSSMRGKSSGIWNDWDFGNSFRPIITLKSDVTRKSGTGVKTDPYIFN